jgi:hypothetical protein
MLLINSFKWHSISPTQSTYHCLEVLLRLQDAIISEKHHLEEEGQTKLFIWDQEYEILCEILSKETNIELCNLALRVLGKTAKNLNLPMMRDKLFVPEFKFKHGKYYAY